MMANSVLTQTVFNAPYGIDETSTRMWLRGKLSFGAGNYITGGVLPGLGVTTAGVLDPLKDASGQVVLIPTLTTPSVGQITAVTSASSGATTTVYTVNTPLAGQYVTFNGLTTSVALNGQTIKVASVSAGASFVVASSVPTQSKTNDTGTATTVIGPDDMEIHSVAPAGYIYQYNKANATIEVLYVPSASALTSALPLLQFPASALDAAIPTDTIHYVASWAKQ
jgi:hypothetical protein